MKLWKDHDPTPDERRYVRNVKTGERGYMVRRNGEDMVRYDRPQEILTKRTENWVDDLSTAMFTLHQVAKVAYAADRALLAALGKYVEAKAEWQNMKEQKRIDWVKLGPEADDTQTNLQLRLAVWHGIMSILQPLAK